MKTLITLVLAACSAVAVNAQAQREAPPAPAPPPGSAAIFKAGAELMALLKAAPVPASGMTTAPIALTDQYRINIVHRAKSAGAIAHAVNSEVHYIIDGAATFVSGGTIVPAAVSGAAAEIRNGVARHVAKGDVVVIPENSAHWYKDVEGEITYLEVRFVAPAK
jgi:mannose-6-phosphate isomerase-like protein (cupin superfamily)